MVTVLEGHFHTVEFLAVTTGGPAIHLGVTAFGQCGALDSVCHHHGLDTDTTVGAALEAPHR